MDSDLISAFVGDVRRRLRWRPDVGDLADEVEDHLRQVADRLASSGTPPREAERLAIARFGESDRFARSLATTANGSLAIPTRGTRVSGMAALAAAAAWLGALVTGPTGGLTDIVYPWSLEGYLRWLCWIGAALLLTVWALVGALVRIGRLRDPRGMLAIAVGALIVPLLVFYGWGTTFLAAALGLAVLGALVGESTDRVTPLKGLGVWVLAAAANIVFDKVVPLGPTDEWGDHPYTWLFSFSVGAIVTIVCLALTGFRLVREHPAELGTSSPLGATPG